jgi:hypothetical protein
MWAGYRAGKEAEPSTGEIRVSFHPGRLVARRRAAVEATRERAARMQPRLLDAIVAAYPTLQQSKPEPSTVTRAMLESLIRLWGITVTSDHHDDIAYVAYFFSCAWHYSGFVALTHGDRVVSVGGLEVLTYPLADPARPAPRLKLPTAAQRLVAKAQAKLRARRNPARLPADGFEGLQIYLPAWAGFCAEPSVRPRASRGEVLCEAGDGPDAPVGPEQQAAYRHLVRNDRAMQRRVLDAIVAEYPTPTSGYALVDRVELDAVYIQSIHVGGLAYVGYGLRCGWDTEHGLGVLTHGDRVVEVGGADTAFLGWIAERDRAAQPGPSSP